MTKNPVCLLIFDILRQDFSKDRPSLGTVVKKFLDFDEIWHSDAFQGETDENSSHFLWKNFRFEIRREIQI